MPEKLEKVVDKNKKFKKDDKNQLEDLDEI